MIVHVCGDGVSKDSHTFWYVTDEFLKSVEGKSDDEICEVIINSCQPAKVHSVFEADLYFAKSNYCYSDYCDPDTRRNLKG